MTKLKSIFKIILITHMYEKNKLCLLFKQKSIFPYMHEQKIALVMFGFYSVLFNKCITLLKTKTNTRN